jgi:hypothetical protein
MTTQRKRYNAEFKARVTLEALQGHKTVNALKFLLVLRHIKCYSTH